jgi:hypothetical protein
LLVNVLEMTAGSSSRTLPTVAWSFFSSPSEMFCLPAYGLLSTLSSVNP